MSDPNRKTVPLWQRLTASGSVRSQVAGVAARLADGDSADALSATWLVSAASLGGLAPRVGDRCRGTDGAWRTVRDVGEPNDAGEWPVLLEREGGGE